jgi:tetratricopeptide (TPR) repeat protein
MENDRLKSQGGWKAAIVSPWVGATVWALVALSLYAVTLNRIPALGVSAGMIESHAGLLPYPDFLHPAWGYLVRLMEGVSIGTLSQRLNLLSALFGAMTVGGLYLILRLFPLLRRLESDEIGMSILRASTASLYLMICIPFWFVSTRAHPLTFDLFLLLTSVFLLGWYLRSSRIRWAYGSVILFGICFAEYSTSLVLFFVYVPAFMYILWRNGALRFRHGIPLILILSASAAAVYVAGALHVLAAPVNELNHERTLFEILRTMLGLEFRHFVRSLPRTGWLMVMMVSTLPWIGCLSFSRQRETQEFRGSMIALQFVVLVIVLGVHFNVPIAPWALIGESHPLAFPYLLLATCMGYLAVYGCSCIREVSLFFKWIPARFSYVYGFCVVALILASGFRAAMEIRPRSAQGLYTCAEAIVDAAGERSILITDGVLDSLVRIVAHEQGRKLDVTSLQAGSSHKFRAHLGQVFGVPQLASLADAGLEPMLKAALVAQPELANRMVLQRKEELWVAGGYTSVPDRLIYVGISKPSEADTARLLQDNVAFWEKVESQLPLPNLENPGIQDAMAAHMRLQISRVANDVGVFLNSQEEPEQAAIAFLAAIRFREDNVSARLNHYVLQTTREGGDEEAKEAREVLSLLVSGQPLNPVAVVQNFGRIRTKEAIQVLKELSGIKEQSRGDKADPRFVEATRAYMVGDLDTATARLDSILSEEEGEDAVWMFRGLIAYRSGDLQMWDQCWNEMTGRKKGWIPFLLIRAEQAVAEGNVDMAREYYKGVLTAQPEAYAVLESMAHLEYLHGQDSDSMEYVNRLLTINPWNPLANGILGTKQATKGEHEKALAALRVATQDGQNPLFLNNLAWVLNAMERHEEALEAVNAALKLFPNLGGAWDTKGLILIGLDRVPEAQEAMDKAVEMSPNSAAILLHRAELADRLGDEVTRDQLMAKVTEQAGSLSEEDASVYESLIEP